jgi:hypothetical protein
MYAKASCDLNPNEIQKIKYSVTGIRSSKIVSLQRRIFGSNELSIPTASFVTQLLDQLLSPLSVFRKLSQV